MQKDCAAIIDARSIGAPSDASCVHDSTQTAGYVDAQGMRCIKYGPSVFRYFLASMAPHLQKSMLFPAPMEFKLIPPGERNVDGSLEQS